MTENPSGEFVGRPDFLPYGIIQIVLSLPFQNRENGIFTAETVTQWNCPIFSKRSLKVGAQEVSFGCGFVPNPKDREGILGILAHGSIILS